MKINKLISALILILLTLNALSQDHNVKMGNKYFDQFDYIMAAKYYSSCKDNAIPILRNLALCYSMTNDLENAKITYEKIIALPDKTFDDLWNYFLVLEQLQQYDKATALLAELAALKPNDIRVKNYLNDGNYYKELLSQNPNYELKNLKMNSSLQDFAPAIINNIVVYTTSRNRTSLVNRTWAGNHQGYLNLYMANISNDYSFKKGKPFKTAFNKKYHDGPACFNQDATLMFFTRNNYQYYSSDGTKNLQLFSSEFVDGNWTTPVAFPYNSNEYSVGQASITPDGKFLFFVSDMPGGVGGTDIYVVERKSNGDWGNIINLKDINTEGNEMFPIYHTDGILFFSSNGWPSLGGLDVFSAPIFGDSFNITGKPENLGTPINGPADDFALTFDHSQKFGYLSSNRADGQGDDDIFLVNTIHPKKYKKWICGVTKNQDNQMIPNADVLLSLNNKTVAQTTSDINGQFSFVVINDATFDLSASKPNFENGQNTANTNSPYDTTFADIILTQQNAFAIRFIIKDKNTDSIIPFAPLHLKNNITFDEEDFVADNEGAILIKLQNAKLNDNVSYYLSVNYPDYVSFTQNYYQKLIKSGTYLYTIYLAPLSQEFVLGEDIGKRFNINPIYFDLNKFNIRPDAAVELDKIVQIMNAYPDLIIELGSHTDCRASYSYNMTLSQKRAKASADYIKKRITNPKRIYGKGYGETHLINDCKCEGKEKSPCSDEQHQANRRTEFKVIAIGKPSTDNKTNNTPKTAPVIEKKKQLTNITTPLDENPVIDQFIGKGTIYTVQVKISKSKINLIPSNFYGYSDIFCYIHHDVYKYTIGQSPSFNEISAILKDLRKFYPQAFIVKFVNGVRVN